MDNVKVKELLPLILSGLLTGALQVWLFLPWLSFVSIVPLGISIYKLKSKKEYFQKIIAFLLPYYFIQTVFLITVYNLISIPSAVGIFISLLLVCAVTMWLTVIMLIPLCFYPFVRSGRKYDLLIFCLLFVFGECLAEYIPILSFPWSGLWLSVVSQPVLTQPAALLGCRFVSLIILVENFIIVAAICTPKIKSKIKFICVFALIMMLNLGYSSFHINHIKKDVDLSRSVKVMAAQDNIEGRNKNNVVLSDAVDSYISIIEQNWQDGIELVLLPETAVPKTYDKDNEDFQRLLRFVKDKNTTILTGCFYKRDDKKYNAMFSVTKNGFCKSPYLKQILVPFGEKIPMASLWGVNTVTSAKHEDCHCLLSDNGIKVASAICIESIYPSITRRQIKSGGQLLCISTNDSWFGKSYARYAHYRHSIMRAVESGRYTLRSGNCGISAIISPWGEEIVSETRPVKSAVVADIKLMKSQNLYTYTGDIIVLPGFAIAVFGFIKVFPVLVKKLKIKFKKSC